MENDNIMKESELREIENTIAKIKAQTFYGVLTIIFSFLAGMQIFYWLYHKNEHNLYHVALGGMWLVVGIAIYINGYISNYYKRIIKQLLFEVHKQKRDSNI
jgi:uncharacterized membrane protein